MNSFSLLIAVLLISSGYFFLGTRSSKAVRTAGARLHSLPHYYGLFAGLVAALPALALLAILAIGDDIIFNRLALDFVPDEVKACLLYTSPSPRDQRGSRMPSSA